MVAIRSAADFFLLLRMVLFSSLVPALMRLRLAWLNRLLGVKVPYAASPIIDPEKLRMYMELAIRFGRPFVRAGCLTRGVTLYYFLRREAGLDVSLCFGAGEVNGKFDGHCWLLQNGEPFWEKRDPTATFKEYYRLPRRAGRR